MNEGASVVAARAALDGQQARRSNALRHRFERPPSGTGPLDGTTFLVKANIAVAGAPLDAASAVLEGYHSPFTATAVTRLLRAGAFLLGSTNMDEFGMGSSSEWSVQGPVEHPRAPGRVVGGSSGGSAVAVAEGWVDFALGSDTGGSVRQPAAFCSIVGLRPSWGRVSRRGLVAYASSLDTIGVLAARVDLTGRVLACMAGPDPLDATCADRPVEVDPAGGSGETPVGVGGWRFGYDPAWLAAARPAVRTATEDSLRRLRAVGARCVPVHLPALRPLHAAYAVIAAAEAASNLARYDGSLYGRRVDGPDYETMVTRTRQAGLGPEVRTRLLLGTYVLTRGRSRRWYERALGVRARARKAFARAFARCDVLLTPTTPEGAFGRGERRDDPVALASSDCFTVGPSLAGLPAIALPTGESGDGLRHSVQLVAPPFAESTLLAAALRLEALYPAAGPPRPTRSSGDAV